ncbi:PTS sugar transporter subunit IIA [Desulfomicrobium escambiense]|uniref:PTS sugar transporter subunit IIA n=1 Tax=Desulfomicrobium escambiense TaxID=29503 RepID=UPI00041ACAD2|nr:PTS sugar transporter subunit IIA [Desulfomicrobium escambiense]
MKLAEYLDKDLIIPDLSARTKKEVLAELVSSLPAKFPGVDANRVAQVLMDRELLGTTGIGDGIAIPHGKLDSLGQVMVIVGRSREGVDFASLDHKPATIFFTVLAPSNVVGLHLKILATISRLLKDTGFRQAFSDAADGESLWRLLQSV